jgi:hypothetical protein
MTRSSLLVFVPLLGVTALTTLVDAALRRRALFARKFPEIGVKADSLGKVLRGGRAVTARLAYGVARLTDVSIDDLLARPPDDFVEEETVVMKHPREAVLNERGE